MEGKVLNQTYKKYLKIGEGSSGKVYLAQRIQGLPQQNNENKDTNHPNKPAVVPCKGEERRYYALKKIKMNGKIEAVNDVRELKMMQNLHHPNIMSVEEWFEVDKGYSKSIYVVMEYMVDLKDLISTKELKLSDVQFKQVLYQIVLAVEHLHNHNYLHRDVKPANIMLTRDGVLKLADFSIATKRRQTMTGNTTTRYYRAPEIIYGHKQYGFEIDMWSLGCTFAQMLLHEPIFPGLSDINQLEKIFSIVGYPRDLWPNAQDKYPYYLDFEPQPQVGLKNLLPTTDANLLDLISKLLTLDPEARPTISAVKAHPYFEKVSSNREELAKVTNYIFEKKLTTLLKN